MPGWIVVACYRTLVDARIGEAIWGHTNAGEMNDCNCNLDKTLSKTDKARGFYPCLVNAAVSVTQLLESRRLAITEQEVDQIFKAVDVDMFAEDIAS